MTDCVFCEIIADPTRQMPGVGGTVAVWPDVIAIEPLGPVVPGHVLVIPRIHVVDFMTDSMVAATAMARASELARHLHIHPANLITSAGRAATQSVWHLHIHLIPRKENDGIALPWYSGRTRKAH
jgi:histidine triad (HIT) family protein